MADDRASERARVVEIAARAAFEEAWSRYPNEFGPSFEEEEGLFLPMMRSALAALSAAGFAVVRRDDAEWTEGVMADGAAILRDGIPVTISDLLAHLNHAADLARDPTTTQERTDGV